MLEFAPTKDELPKDTDLYCPICFDNIDLDGTDDDNVPNCVICDNGHRCHNTCYRQYDKRQCPTCANTHMHFCKSNLGYGYAERKGGKKNKGGKTKKSYKKKKTCKRRKSCKRRK